MLPGWHELCIGSTLGGGARAEGDGVGTIVATLTSSPPLLPMPDGPQLIFLIMGILQTLSAIFKTGHQCNLLLRLRGIKVLWEESILVAEGPLGGGGP